MREINCEKLHNHHVVITHAQPEVNFSSNRIGHVSCIKARGLRPRADYIHCITKKVNNVITITYYQCDNNYSHYL